MKWLNFETPKNVTFQNIFKPQVSWLKRIGADKDPHLLTYGRQTYSSDARFQVSQVIFEVSQVIIGQ